MAEDLKHVPGSIGDEFGAVLRETIRQNKRYRKALECIAANTCCERCREAALVAKAALQEDPCTT